MTPTRGLANFTEGNETMNMLSKNLIGGAVLGALALSSAVSSVAMADDHADIKHKVIQIKAIKDHETNITVNTDAVSDSFFFSQEELEDDNLIYDKIAHLDDETRETILNALDNIKRTGDSTIEVLGDNVTVLNKGKGQRFVFLGTDNSVRDIELDVVHDGEHKTIKKHVIIGGAEGMLKGHADAIVTMIERGEFDQDELDEIQAAVDAKR